MTIGEFRAFIEGMAIDGHPTEHQWARIVEKLALVGDLDAAILPSPHIWQGNGRIYGAGGFAPRTKIASGGYTITGLEGGVGEP